MTELDDIKAFALEMSASNREFFRALKEEDLAKKADTLRDSFLDLLGADLALYKVTEFTARRVPIELAVEIWGMTRQSFRKTFERWENVEKVEDPEIAGLLEHLCKVLRDLVSKADQEYRSYTETAHLISSPVNAKRLAEAIDEARSGKLPVFNSPEEAKKSLR